MPLYNELLRDEKSLILCEDGSSTLYSKEFDEPYHSTKDGALYESLEKYVKPSLTLKQHKNRLVILDICFGLGYNAFATIYYIKKQKLATKIHIIAPEFDQKLITSLKDFNYPQEFDKIKDIIEAVSKSFYYEDEQFKIEILLGDARETVPQIKDKIDIIYQDAFSPKNNPLLWTKEWFKTVRNVCTNDAILTTYSTAIATRMGLYENGFYIFVHRANLMRYSTIASLKMLEDKEYIDMELKKKRNKEAQSLRDNYYNI